MKIKFHGRDPSNQTLIITTDQSRYPVFVPFSVHMNWKGEKGAVAEFVVDEIERRRRDRLLQDGRHDHFKGFRA